MFGQTIELHDAAVIGLLVVLEGILSIDNALVLGVLARRLPKHQQRKALTYGLVGAFVFRLMAIAAAAWLLKWTFVKLLGGGYLIWIAVKHFFLSEHHDPADKAHAVGDLLGDPALVGGSAGTPNEALAPLEPDPKSPSPVNQSTAVLEPARLQASPPAPTRRYARFWPTVFVIEMTDIAFAVDSILAAIGVVGSPPPGHPKDAVHPKLWVVIAGGFMGVILMRFAAILFIKLLERFPRFEVAAYLLVIVIGFKLLVDWASHVWHFEHLANFHSLSSPAFWVFWVAMMACFAVGFLPQKDKDGHPLRPA